MADGKTGLTKFFKLPKNGNGGVPMKTVLQWLAFAFALGGAWFKFEAMEATQARHDEAVRINTEERIGRTSDLAKERQQLILDKYATDKELSDAVKVLSTDVSDRIRRRHDD